MSLSNAKFNKALIGNITASNSVCVCIAFFNVTKFESLIVIK